MLQDYQIATTYIGNTNQQHSLGADTPRGGDSASPSDMWPTLN